MAYKKPQSVRDGEGPRPGGGRGARGYSKPKNTKGILLRLLAYINEYRLQVILALLMLAGSSLSNVAGTYMLKPLINDHIVPFIGQASFDKAGFFSTVSKMLVIYVLGVCCSYGTNRLLLNVTTGTLRKIRIDLFGHMEKLPIRYFDTHTHGEIMSHYTNDTDAMREMLSMSIPQVVSSTISAVSMFVMMVILSWQMTLMVLVMLGIMLFAIRIISGNSARYFIAQQRELASVNGYIEEMIEGQKVVKVFTHEPQVKQEFDELNEDLFHAASNANIFANILMPVMGNLGYMNFAFLSVLGGTLAIKGVLDLGTIGSFLQYSRNFNMPITMMSQQINSVLTALAGAERIFAMIDEPVEVDNGNVTLVNAHIADDGSIEECEEHTGKWAWKTPQEDGSFSYTQLRGDVRFFDVDFSYVPEKRVLDDITLYAKPGQKIAFVGSTGAGKTTITNLINRFYDIQEGEIVYDGINIKNIKKDDLRNSLSMVLQDTHLFTGTVMENIRYGKLEATDEEVIAAAKLANADYFISHLPQGYHTVLTADGANLSQGQRQLLAIARAAVADPPVLILDEATSSIDTRTEALIEKGMDHLMEDRTVFVIAHRLSTVRNSNAIMVLEKGRIIERGDHESLIAEKGRYYQLYTGAFELQ